MSKAGMLRDLTTLSVGTICACEAVMSFGVSIPLYTSAKAIALGVGAFAKSNALATIGATMAGVGIVGAGYVKWAESRNVEERKKLMNVFEEGAIYLKKGDIKIFPTIRGISYSKEKIEIVFTLPLGLKYELVEKQVWLFQQMWTDYVEMKREGKNVRVCIYFEAIKKFDYNYLEIEQFLKKHKFPIYVGKGREGHICYDATGNANLLVAGINGSGKSAFLRGLNCTWLQYFTPDQIELHLCDLKKSEFGIYRKVKHVRSVSNTIDQVRKVVKKIRKELDRRCEILDEAGENHINDVKGVKLPIIVLEIDEVAVLDLKNSDNKDLAYDINLICALGRAVNVQVILSMQRPDAEQLDSKAKANLNVRAIFRQNSVVNSGVALDSDEASKIPIESKGLMAFSFDEIKYVQSAWLSQDKAKEIIAEAIKKYGENDLQKVIVVENNEIVEEEKPKEKSTKKPKRKHLRKLQQEQDFNVFGDDNIETA